MCFGCADLHRRPFAREDLFDGQTWYLTPTAATSGILLERLHRTLTGLGARPAVIDAETHDVSLESVPGISVLTFGAPIKGPIVAKVTATGTLSALVREKLWAKVVKASGATVE